MSITESTTARKDELARGLEYVKDLLSGSRSKNTLDVALAVVDNLIEMRRPERRAVEKTMDLLLNARRPTAATMDEARRLLDGAITGNVEETDYEAILAGRTFLVEGEECSGEEFAADNAEGLADEEFEARCAG